MHIHTYTFHYKSIHGKNSKYTHTRLVALHQIEIDLYEGAHSFYPSGGNDNMSCLHMSIMLSTMTSFSLLYIHPFDK